jgi:hypothetical protein
MLPVKLFVLVLYPALASFVGRTELCISAEFIDFVLGVRHMAEIPRVHVKKAITFPDRQIRF